MKNMRTENKATGVTRAQYLAALDSLGFLSISFAPARMRARFFVFIQTYFSSVEPRTGFLQPKLPSRPFLKTPPSSFLLHQQKLIPDREALTLLPSLYQYTQALFSVGPQRTLACERASGAPNNILYPVPHRQFVFSIPMMMRSISDTTRTRDRALPLRQGGPTDVPPQSAGSR